MHRTNTVNRARAELKRRLCYGNNLEDSLNTSKLHLRSKRGFLRTEDKTSYLHKMALLLTLFTKIHSFANKLTCKKIQAKDKYWKSSRGSNV